VFDGVTGGQLAGPIGSFFAYDPGFTGGVRVAASDITGDGLADIITAPGPTGGPNVRAFDAASTGTVPEQIGDILVEDPDFRGGIFVGASVNLESAVAPLTLGSEDLDLLFANGDVFNDLLN
jgi:hypothetical protein